MQATVEEAGSCQPQRAANRADRHPAARPPPADGARTEPDSGAPESLQPAPLTRGYCLRR